MPIAIQTELMPTGVRMLKLAGTLEVFTFVEFKKTFDDLVAVGKDIQVVVDLSKVTYIASSGWSVLLSRRKMLKIGGGDLTVFGLHPDIKRVYDSMRIGKRLPLGADADAAIKLLGAPEAP